MQFFLFRQLCSDSDKVQLSSVLLSSLLKVLLFLCGSVNARHICRIFSFDSCINIMMHFFSNVRFVQNSPQYFCVFSLTVFFKSNINQPSSGLDVVICPFHRLISNQNRKLPNCRNQMSNCSLLSPSGARYTGVRSCPR